MTTRASRPGTRDTYARIVGCRARPVPGGRHQRQHERAHLVRARAPGRLPGPRRRPQARPRVADPVVPQLHQRGVGQLPGRHPRAGADHARARASPPSSRSSTWAWSTSLHVLRKEGLLPGAGGREPVLRQRGRPAGHSAPRSAWRSSGSPRMPCGPAPASATSQLGAQTISVAAGGGVRVGLEDGIHEDRARTRLATNPGAGGARPPARSTSSERRVDDAPTSCASVLARAEHVVIPVAAPTRLAYGGGGCRRGPRSSGVLADGPRGSSARRSRRSRQSLRRVRRRRPTPSGSATARDALVHRLRGARPRARRRGARGRPTRPATPPGRPARLGLDPAWSSTSTRTPRALHRRRRLPPLRTGVRALVATHLHGDAPRPRCPRRRGGGTRGSCSSRTARRRTVLASGGSTWASSAMPPPTASTRPRTSAPRAMPVPSCSPTPEHADRARSLREYGWGERYRVDHARGRNSRLDAVHAAALTARLPFLDARNERRREIATQLRDACAGERRPAAERRGGRRGAPRRRGHRPS